MSDFRMERRISIMCAVAALAFGARGAYAEEWGYACEEGPAEWCHLSEAYELCCDGIEQTPIDLCSRCAERTTLPELVFAYGVVDLDVEHNGHTIKANVPRGTSYLWVGGVAYELLQFHWHTPSEHWLNGEPYAMELHLVHQGPDGSLLVFGVLIQAGEVNETLNDIWKQLPQHEHDKVSVPAFNISALVPHSNRTLRYHGSLTTPPCGEGVSWIVQRRIAEMSAEQIEAFVKLFSGPEFPQGNARPLQPRNGRVVQTEGS